MQETKFKVGDLLEFCTEKQQLMNSELVYDGYGMVVDIQPGEHIDEMIYTVDIYKGTETSIKANADITGFKFKFYDHKYEDCRLIEINDNINNKINNIQFFFFGVDI